MNNLCQRAHSPTMQKILSRAVMRRLYEQRLGKVIVHHYTDIPSKGVQVEYEYRKMDGTVGFGRIVL